MNRATYLVVLSGLTAFTLSHPAAVGATEPATAQAQPTHSEQVHTESVQADETAKPVKATAPKQLSLAVSKANAAVRRAKETESHSALAKAELGDELWCEATITQVETSAENRRVVRAQTTVVRPVTICNVAGDQAIRASASALNSASSQANKALRDFEQGWKPVKSGRPMYVRTKWGGCPSKWPRITEDEYNSKRNNHISQGKQAIATAQAQLEATRAQVRETRQQEALVARTVQLNLQPTDEKISVDKIQVGQRVRFTLRVDSLEIKDDAATVKNPVKHIGTVHARITGEPQIIETAFATR